ncbi:MAG: hypothetical protein LUD27_06640 [Clostridia bacterium]|nr:hypothetical protein [Clostridia bacterium]
MKLIEKVLMRRTLMSHRNDKLPIAVGYKIMKLLKQTEEDDKFYQTKLTEIADTYGEKDPDGKLLRSKEGNIIIQNGKKDECNALIKELEETDVEEAEIKFTLDELAPINFSVDELFNLEHCIICE